MLGWTQDKDDCYIGILVLFLIIEMLAKNSKY